MARPKSRAFEGMAEQMNREFSAMRHAFLQKNKVKLSLLCGGSCLVIVAAFAGVIVFRPSEKASGSTPDTNDGSSSFSGTVAGSLSNNVNGVQLEPAATEDQWKAIKTQVNLAVVKIVSKGCGGNSQESGVYVRPGLIATAAHGVSGTFNPLVYDDLGSRKARLIFIDNSLDFALLAVSRRDNATVKLSGSGLPSFYYNYRVAIFGHPGGGELNSYDSKILDKFVTSTYNRTVLQLNQKLHGGVSGGPVVNANGELVGLIFASETDPSLTNSYATPIDDFRAHIDAYNADSATISSGYCTTY